MMSVGLHCRLIGRPGRVQALRRFIEYVQSHDKVWIARRIDIAEDDAVRVPEGDRCAIRSDGAAEVVADVVQCDRAGRN